MFHNFSEAQQYLEQHIFSKDKYVYPRLDKIKLLLKYLENPERKFPSIHIGGTSGKGSTSYITASILETAGYKVGLTISPHLQKITERIQINRQPISDEKFIFYINRLQPFIEKIGQEYEYGAPSFFEILIAIAFLYFAEEKVDVAVVEVGLGGKLDATNVLDSQVSIFTNVGLDHMDWLGYTVQKIGRDKMEIIKPNSIAVTGVTQNSIKKLIQQKCQSLNTKLFTLYDNFDYEILNFDNTGSKFNYHSHFLNIQNIKLGLKGKFQISNAALAITACYQFEPKKINSEIVKKALQNLNFPARLEITKFENHTFIIDGAHNSMKMKALVSSLKSLYPHTKFPLIVAIKCDKNYQAMLRLLLPLASTVYVTEFYQGTDLGKKLSLSHLELSKFIEKYYPKLEVQNLENVAKAIEIVKKLPDQNILITGSLYLCGEARNALHLN